MKKVYLSIVTVLLCCFTGCEKTSDNNVPASIVGWWEYIDEESTDSTTPSPKAYRWVVCFDESGFDYMFDNIVFSEDGDKYYSDTLLEFQRDYYWIEGDTLCSTSYLYPEECSEFGFPQCECNEDGLNHYCKIVALTSKTLTIEIHSYDDVYAWTFERIEKPSKLKYREDYK